MLRGLFARDSGSRNQEAGHAARIKGWAREMLGTDVELMVSEIDCGDPACPGLETVILVLRPGEKTRAVKLACPMSEVMEQDLCSCLDQLDHEASR